MDQPSLFVDSLNDAVRDTCRMIGMKRIAKLLWPSKSEDEAARYLNDCLNEDRPQKLSGEEIMVIGEEGRKLGCHLIGGYVNQRLHYAPPVPVDPADEKAELQRQFIDAVGRAERLGKLLAAR